MWECVAEELAVRSAMGEAGDGRDGDSVQSRVGKSSSSDADEHCETQLDDEVVEAAGDSGTALMRRADGEGTAVRVTGVDTVDERIREERVGIVGDREAR